MTIIQNDHESHLDTLIAVVFATGSLSKVKYTGLIATFPLTLDVEAPVLVDTNPSIFDHH